MKASTHLLFQHDMSTDLIHAFQDFRNENELLDVTLACEDETLQAHKVVLSASSSFFRSLFRKIKQNNSIIYLHGVLYKDLVALLDYLYTGKAQILAEDVDRFIQVARELKINGLFEDESKAEDNVGINDDVSEVESVKQLKAEEIKNVDKKCKKLLSDRSDIEGLMDSSQNIDNIEDIIVINERTKNEICVKKLEKYTEDETIAEGNVIFQSQLENYLDDQKSNPPPSWDGRRLFPPCRKNSKPSKVWNFGGFFRDDYGQLMRNETVCGLCGLKIKYRQSPSNFLQHLQVAHTEQLLNNLGKLSAFKSEKGDELDFNLKNLQK